MEEKNQHKKSKWRWMLIAIAVILVLIAAARIALKSNWVLDKARDIVIEQANNQINGSLHIKNIRGDLLNGFTVTGIKVQDSNQADVLLADTVQVQYQITSLISSFQVEELNITGVDLFLTQNSDSVWNVETLLPESEEEPSGGESSVNWQVEQLLLQNTNVNIYSEHLLPDDQLSIERIHANASAGVQDDGFNGLLRSLDFRVMEERLPEPIDVWLSGSGTEEQYTLEKLVVRTGRTWFESAGEYQAQDEFDFEAAFTPLSQKDLAAYIEDLPLSEDLRVEIGASGSLSDMNLTLNASAGGMEDFSIRAGLRYGDALVMNSLQVTSGVIDAYHLTGQEELPSISSFSFTGEGSLDVENPGQAIWSGNADITGFSFDEYTVDSFSSTYQWENGQAEFNAMATYNGQEVELAAAGDNLTGNTPAWNARISSEGFNPSIWLNNPEMDGELNILGELNGESFDPDNFIAAFDIAVAGDRFGEQSFSELRLEGSVNAEQLDGMLTARLERGELMIDLLAEKWQSEPEYDFEARLSEFNLQELTAMEDFPTYLNATLRGSGRGTDPETLNLNAALRFDSSQINNEPVDTLVADVSVQNGFFSVENAQFNSAMADAEFSLRQHIQQFTNTGNRLDFVADVKDLTPLAPLFGFERLDISGDINGNMVRGEEGIPEFYGDFNFEDIAVDTLFSSGQVSGTITTYLQNEPEIDLEIEFTEPGVNGLSVQDVTFYTYATFAGDEIHGNIGFTVSDQENSIFHRGEFTTDLTRTHLQTTGFEFTTALRTLHLSEPFDITYSDDILRVDTLNIGSENGGAYLTLWAPHIDSLKQQGGLEAQNLNLGAMQKALIGDPVFEGTLSGALDFSNSTDTLEVSASGLLNEFSYQKSGEMDSLRFKANLEDEWLDMDLDGWHQTEKYIEAMARIPFLPGDPLTFDEQFFDRSIEGSFNLFSSDINYWLSFLPENDFEETEGNISAEVVLGGVAGNPQFDGSLMVVNGQFSGIPVDSVGMDVFYRHDEETINLEGGITAQRKPVLDFNATLPFLVDLKRAEVLLPSDEDSVYASVETNEFDLALFESYLDREMIRQLRGELDGEVTISGQLAALRSEGYMNLTNGRMRVVPAGITINDIESRLNFEPERIELERFRMTSSPGRIRASGHIDLDDLSPGQLQLTAKGERFQAANTRTENAIVNFDVSLDGTMENPDLNGSLTFLNGFIFLQNFGERSVEDVRLEEEDEIDQSFAFYDSLAMEVDVNFDRQFYIRGDQQFLEMEIELAGQVDVLKDRNDELEIFGPLEGVEGYARPLGKNFELDNAVLSFSGPVDNPDLNIRTLFEPPQRDSEVRIYYIIEGTAQEPEFRFESEPEMELQDIISYTLFGRPFYELESWEQTVAGNGTGTSAADLAIDVLLDRVEILASQRLGIDVVQIDNSGSGSNSTTSIKTGWYLNQKTFFAILNEISSSNPQTLFILEYLLRENLELILTQGDDSREGIDLRWHFDY